MDKSFVLARLRHHESELRAAGIIRLQLFGSVAREEASSQSDVDLLADFDMSRMEAAIASHSDFIITFNKRHFPDSLKFGIRCLTPQEFLILLEEPA